MLLLEDQSAVLSVDIPQLFISFCARWHFMAYVVPAPLLLKLYYIFLLFLVKPQLILKGRLPHKYQRGVYNQFHWRASSSTVRGAGQEKGRKMEGNVDRPPYSAREVGRVACGGT